MKELVKYEAARKALAEARAVDEVLEIRNQSFAFEAYARQAKNRSMEADALEIRMRATRRLDQLRQEQKATVGLNAGRAGKGRPNLRGVSETPPNDERPTLAQAGIDKNLAKKGRKLGALSDDDFESEVKKQRDKVKRVIKNAIPDDDDENDGFDLKLAHKQTKQGFLARAYQAQADAKFFGKVDSEIIEAAEETAAAWCQLVSDLKKATGLKK